MQELRMSALGPVLLVLAAGCSPGQPPDRPPPRKSALESQVVPLERAREVEATIHRSAEDSRKALDAQERGEPPP